MWSLYYISWHPAPRPSYSTSPPTSARWTTDSLTTSIVGKQPPLQGRMPWLPGTGKGRVCAGGSEAPLPALGSIVSPWHVVRTCEFLPCHTCMTGTGHLVHEGSDALFCICPCLTGRTKSILQGLGGLFAFGDVLVSLQRLPFTACMWQGGPGWRAEVGSQGGRAVLHPAPVPWRTSCGCCDADLSQARALAVCLVFLLNDVLADEPSEPRRSSSELVWCWLVCLGAISGGPEEAVPGVAQGSSGGLAPALVGNSTPMQGEAMTLSRDGSQVDCTGIPAPTPDGQHSLRCVASTVLHEGQTCR